MSKANSFERQMLDLINSERAAIGVDPLQLDFRLNASSERHSDWMLTNNIFSHDGAGGSNAGARMREAGFEFAGDWSWGENVAWQSERGASGIADDVVSLHAALMASPGHRDNILDPDYELIGIGIETGDFSGWDAVMVTQNFARSAAPAMLDAPPLPATPAAASPAPAMQAEDPNAAPLVTVADITVGRARGAYRTDLADHLRVTDADGDAPVWFELRDTQGRDNFVFRGQGVIDTEAGFRVDADEIGMVRVRTDRRPGETTLEIRAFDGEDVGAWEEFTVTTLSAADWAALA
ncbi:CAP domain-containing protein [Limimaricola pyoseonensis]|uniref:Cysteine-rich secretory protein family protein n=1 Tax=Limimaricola pyoseonensis TaxID=521013 RepID=A0A1G7AIP7_9RHOB|nr:CAP domain-containing protein [Limimaricola pyoseonensis]SDE14357.1 Cysteine-rich secretory protein family protein [Limimaricola pyoseonensis]